jgi:hypothetical protein
MGSTVSGSFRMLMLILVSVRFISADADGPDYFAVSGIRKDELVCMHKKPDFRSPSVAAIPHGTRCLENLATVPQGDMVPPDTDVWYKVEYFGKKGWIPASRISEDYNCTAPADADDLQKVLITARSRIGSPYRPSRSGPESFDCSGFVYYVFKKAGISIPRTALAQSQSGTPLKRKELKAGDMVFFDTSGRGHVNHSGIYLGDGRFIHATSGRAFRVTISPLNKGFYKSRFQWGVRKIESVDDNATSSTAAEGNITASANAKSPASQKKTAPKKRNSAKKQKKAAKNKKITGR